MSRASKSLFQVTVLLVVCAGLIAGSAAASNPYASIGERNVFGLIPPPPPDTDEPEPEPEDPPADIKITGITTIGGIQRAIVKLITKADPKTKTPASEEGYIMVAGEPPVDGVQVLEIKDAQDPDDVQIRVKQKGKEMWLALEKDTPKAPPPAATKGDPKAQAAAAKQIAAQRRAAAAGGGGGTVVPPAGGGSPLAIPARRTRAGATVGTTSGQGYPGGVGLQAGGNIPVQQGSQANFSRNRVARDYGLTRDEQIILIEANRDVSFEQELNQAMPPLPPTVDTPQNYYEATGQSPDQPPAVPPGF